MKTYTVKEIREYTGLTRKQLFDYQKGIPPYDHVDNGDPLTEREGYKLYDQEGLNRLSLAALFQKLGKKPKEINEIFCSENYDYNEVLLEIIKEAKQKKRELEDIIIVAEYFKQYDISEFSFSPFQINDLHKLANAFRKELKSDDVRKIQENLDAKKVNKLLRIFRGFEKIKDTEDELVKCEKQIKKIIRFLKDDMKVNNWAHQLTALQVELTSKSLSEFVDSRTNEGISEYISNAIENYQFSNLIDDLDHKYGERIEQLMIKKFDDPEVVQLFDFIWKTIKKWYGFILLGDAISLLQVFHYMFEQFDDDKELLNICTYLLEGFRYFQNNKLLDN